MPSMPGWPLVTVLTSVSLLLPLTTRAQSWVLQEPPWEAAASVARWPAHGEVPPDQIDIRASEWNPLSPGPSVILRLLIVKGQLEVSQVVWWTYLSPDHAPKGRGLECLNPPGKQRVCILPIARSLAADFRTLAATLLAAGPYRPRVTKWPEPPPPAPPTDSPELFVQVMEDGKMRVLRGIDDSETHSAVVKVLRDIERNAWSEK